MLAYALRRILIMIPMLILISVVVFFLALLMPGDPFSGEIDPNKTSAEYLEEMREKQGYNDPIPEQYQRWVKKTITKSDSGKSTKYKKDVIDDVLEKIPNTLFLAVCALIITYILAFILGK